MFTEAALKSSFFLKNLGLFHFCIGRLVHYPSDIRGIVDYLFDVAEAKLSTLPKELPTPSSIRQTLFSFLLIFNFLSLTLSGFDIRLCLYHCRDV